MKYIFLFYLNRKYFTSHKKSVAYWHEFWGTLMCLTKVSVTKHIVI